MEADDSELRRMAARQHGLFTRTQARACGYSAYQVRRRIELGQWQRVLGPVFAFLGASRTPGLLDVVAGLAVPGAVFAGPSAARVHGIPADDRRPWIAVPVAARPRVAGLGVLHERLSRYDVQLIGGVLVTSRVRAFAGRHGVGRLVRLVSAAGSGTRSAAERLTVGLLRRAGLDGFRANLPIHDADGALIGVGDLVFDRERVVVELDGRAYHTTSDRFERDRYRQNRLIGAGWTVLRFTWRDLTQRPDYVVAIVAQARRELGWAPAVSTYREGIPLVARTSR